MKEDQKQLYFYMTVGYAGLFLFIAGMIRYVVLTEEPDAQMLTLFGFMMLMVYVRFAEERMAVPGKAVLICRSLLFIGLVVFTLLFIRPGESERIIREMRGCVV